jgi:hypothetical protein
MARLWRPTDLNVTNSPAAGTKSGLGVIGRRSFALIVVALTLLNAVVGSVSVATDLARRGVAFRPAEPWIWELSSAAALLIWLLPLLRADDALRARLQSAAARLGVRVLASVAYSGLHVATMVALRHAVYAIAGWEYRFGPWFDSFVYEYRKDALTFALILAIAAGWRAYQARMQAPPAPEPPAAEAPAAASSAAAAPSSVAPTFLVRTAGGDVLVRTPEIDWVEAQGNYVALHVQGKVMLMRQTLAELEAQLADHGFIRTHRGALVNGERMQAIITRAGSELGVRLTNGEVAPLSESRRAGVVQRVVGA